MGIEQDKKIFSFCKSILTSYYQDLFFIGVFGIESVPDAGQKVRHNLTA